MAWYISLALLLVIVLVLVYLLVYKTKAVTTAAYAQHQSEKNLATALAELSLYQKQLEDKISEIETLRSHLDNSRRETAQALILNATLKEERDQYKKKLEVLSQEETVRQERLHKEFALIAEKVIEAKSAKVTERQKEDLKTILSPLQEKIDDFKKQVSEAYSTEAKERHTLSHIIKQLSDQSQTLSQEANALTEALRGQSKVQGDWGELILERILEDSGLTQGREYRLQEYITDKYGQKVVHDDTHQRLRPDAIIHFPRERDVIIDAKVSLTAYTDYYEAKDEASRQSALERHLQSVKSHIDDLYKRDYSAYLDSAPDFVIMFFPNEGAYNLAVHGQSDLWQQAYKKKVLLMGPANLIGMLKILYELWSKETQLQNIEKIIESANKMYEKFVNFSENFVNIGKKLDDLQKSYEQAKGQLSSGRGNLVRQIETLRSMGLPSPKKINPSLLESSDTDDNED